MKSGIQLEKDYLPLTVQLQWPDVKIVRKQIFFWKNLVITIEITGN